MNMQINFVWPWWFFFFNLWFFCVCFHFWIRIIKSPLWQVLKLCSLAVDGKVSSVSHTSSESLHNYCRSCLQHTHNRARLHGLEMDKWLPSASWISWSRWKLAYKYDQWGASTHFIRSQKHSHGEQAWKTKLNKPDLSNQSRLGEPCTNMRKLTHEATNIGLGCMCSSWTLLKKIIDYWIAAFPPFFQCLQSQSIKSVNWFKIGIKATCILNIPWQIVSYEVANKNIILILHQPL